MDEGTKEKFTEIAKRVIDVMTKENDLTLVESLGVLDGIRACILVNIEEMRMLGIDPNRVRPSQKVKVEVSNNIN